jgi:hypothetical protein
VLPWVALALGVVLVALVAIAFASHSLALAVQGRGAPDGSWAVAGGAELTGLSVSFARARGTPLVLQLALLGRTILRRRGAQTPAKEPQQKPKREPGRIARVFRRAASRFDPFDAALFVLDERRRISFRDVEGNVELGLADAALAGQISGILCVASATLSPYGRFTHRIDWSGEEHLDASLSLRVRFRPALLALDFLRFIVQTLRAPAERLAAGTAAPPFLDSSPGGLE